MDTALIVALIGVGGTVIVAGLNFWQSRTNLAAANTREREQREEADKIHAEDREERERDRSRADEAAKRARADVWREERVNAHRAALSLLTQINDQFLKAKYDLTSPWKLAEPYSVDQLRQALRDLTLAQSDVELYGSRVSAAALAACAGEAVFDHQGL